MKARFGALAALLLFSPLAGAQNLVPAGAESVSTFLQFDSDRDGKVDRREAEASPSLKTHFERLDLNGDGKITAEEMSGYGPYSYPGGNQSASTFLQFDSDRDGAVSRREAEASTSLLANFFRLDLDGDGKITMSEMPGYPFALLAGSQSASTFLQFDGNRDGKVDRIEARESPSLFVNFSRLDQNRDGKITADEMTLVEYPFRIEDRGLRIEGARIRHEGEDRGSRIDNRPGAPSHAIPTTSSGRIKPSKKSARTGPTVSYAGT